MLSSGLMLIVAAVAVALTSVNGDPIGVIGTITKQETVQKLESGSELVEVYSDPTYTNPI